MSKSNIKVPTTGEKITYKNNKLVVPDNPIIPYIEGDGIGVDITPVMLNVIDAAVEKAYDGKRKISWMEIYCGEKSVKIYGNDEWMPDDLISIILCRISFSEYGVIYTLKIIEKKYISKASKKTGLKRLSRSDFPAAHRTISSLSFLNLLILNKTDKKRQIGIVIISIFGNNSNM